MKFRGLVFEQRKQPLTLKELEKPAYVNDDRFICVDIKAASLNRRDYWITKGLYPEIIGNLPTVLGSDGCGVYQGKEYIICPNANWGNEFFPSPNYTILGLQEYGTFAEKIFVRKDKIFPKPEHLSVQQAACIPLAGLTAYRALFSRSKLKKKQRVLISGVGGGVALLACQFAVAMGAEVYVTSGSEEKIKRAIGLGAIDGVSYSDTDAMDELAKSVKGFDVVIDGAGGKGFSQLLKMCKLGANVSIYGGTKGTISGVAPTNLFFKQISIHGSTMGSDQEFKEMVKFVNDYKIVPIVHKLKKLQNGDEAIKELSTNQHFGKIVLEVN